MLRSKATAALMRLKEMDKKYNVKHKEGKRAVGNVSTESSLENTPRNQRLKASNNKLEHVQTFLARNGENEVASKVSLESEMEIEIQSPRVEDVYPKKSPRTRTEASSEINTNKESASRTEEFLRTVSNLESVTENDSKATSEVKDDASGASQRYSEDFSVATAFSRRSGAPETISEAIKSGHEPLSSVRASNPDNDETTIDEVIGTIDERSQVISELSNAMDKDDFVNEDRSDVSSMDEQKLRYENTFEEASNSTISSSSTEVHLKKSSVDDAGEDTMISGVKQIKITPHKRTESIQEEVVINDEKDKEIIELIGPKMIRSNSECDVGLDEELSNYVKTTENVDVAVPINLLKLSKQGTPARRHVRRSRKHRRSSNENIDANTDTSVVSGDRERVMESKANNNEGVPSKENIFAATTEEAPLKSADVEVAKSETEKPNREPETISSEKLLREIPKKSDVTSTLRELNKDAINAIVRRHRVQTTSRIPDKSRRCKNCKATMKLPSTETSERIEDDESKHASVENVIMDCRDNQKMRGRRTKARKVSKASKARRASHQGKAEDCGQTRDLRKQAAVLRMQQEREDIRNYLLELERTRLEFGPGESILSSKIAQFKPLEFPKILSFKKPNLEDSNLGSNNAVVALQEKILMIQQWLKDQYLLYRDYSKLAQTMNTKYIPANLEDAKKTIRQLQRSTIVSR